MPTKEKISSTEAQDMMVTFKNYLDIARESLKLTQDKISKQANKHGSEPDFGVGDKFFIIKKSWSTTDRPSDKLDFSLTKKSYKITQMKGYSYELEVPSSWRMSKIFHADRLRKDLDNPLPGPGIIDDEEEWEVDRILSS